MEEHTNDQVENKPTESQTPGAAIGSFIVIAILIAGAVYTLNGQLKKPAVDDLDNSSAEATTTLSESAGLDLIDGTTTEGVLLNEEDVDSLLN